MDQDKIQQELKGIAALLHMQYMDSPTKKVWRTRANLTSADGDFEIFEAQIREYLKTFHDFNDVVTIDLVTLDDEKRSVLARFTLGSKQLSSGDGSN